MLTSKGYSLLKSSLDNEEIAKIKLDLTLIPKINFDMGNKKSDEDSKIILYKETDKRIYIPRYYGLSKYGLPEIIKLSGGTDINVEFIGKLREYQNEPVKKFLEAAKNPLKMGGIISVPCGFGKTIMSLYRAGQVI